MRRPSGDQDAREMLAMELLVSSASPEPSAFITHIPSFPSLLDMNAMRPPSGDQDGNQSCAELLVRRVTSEPSAFIVYISQFPSLSDANAMRPPGDDCASAAFWVNGVAPPNAANRASSAASAATLKDTRGRARRMIWEGAARAGVAVMSDIGYSFVSRIAFELGMVGLGAVSRLTGVFGARFAHARACPRRAAASAAVS